MKLLKFDMSEFSESHAVSKLLGSPPGYVGFDQGGLLTNEVDKYPYSVILLDEIEKANSEVFNILLQVMDEGKLTDSTGKQINFTHTIIILTTNLVANKEKSIGFSQDDNAKTKTIMNMEAFNQHFSPEFRSRLDKIILFNPINSIVEKIVSKNLKELAAQLADKKVKLTTAPGVKKYFVDKYFKDKSGARELDKAIDVEIKQFIADEILFGKLKKGGVAIIDFVKKTQSLSLTFSSIDNANKKELEMS